MGLIVLVFVGLAVLTFAVVMLLTRPTAADRAVTARLAGVQRQPVPVCRITGRPQQEFLKDTSLSEFAWLDRFLQRSGLAQNWPCCWRRQRVPGV